MTGQRKDEMPDEQGFYWAKWRIKDAGTEEENEPCPDAWEVVNVFENCNDKNDAEYLRVFVAGVGRSQSLENFYWGEKVTRADLSPPVPDDVAEAVERARDEVRYCYEELHGRKPLKVGHGGKLTCGDLETLIRAASTPSAEVKTLAELHEIIPATPLHEGMTRDIVADAKRLVARRETVEVRALRGALKEIAAMTNPKHTLNGIWAMGVAIEALNQPHTGGK